MSMRKDVYEIFCVREDKINYSVVARQYDVDPRTVKAAYLRDQSDKTTVVRKLHSRRSKLNGCQDIIEDKYAAYVLLDRFMPLSLKKTLLASAQSLKIIVVVFVNHKQKKQRLELIIQLD